MQVLVGFDSGSMITILPERSLPRLSLVVFLGGAARNQLHASGNNVWAGVLDQKMNINQIVSDLYFLHSMIVTV